MLLPPGSVKTDVGGPHAMVTPAESIAGMRRVIDEVVPGQRLTFLAYQDENLPW